MVTPLLHGSDFLNPNTNTRNNEETTIVSNMGERYSHDVFLMYGASRTAGKYANMTDDETKASATHARNAAGLIFKPWRNAIKQTATIM